MDTKIWQELKKGCPLRDGEVCKATPDLDMEFEYCKYQKDCPFVYWLTEFKELFRSGRF